VRSRSPLLRGVPEGRGVLISHSQMRAFRVGPDISRVRTRSRPVAPVSDWPRISRSLVICVHLRLKRSEGRLAGNWHEINPSPEGAKQTFVAPLQGLLYELFQYPGRCPGLVSPAPLGLIRFDGEGKDPGRIRRSEPSRVRDFRAKKPEFSHSAMRYPNTLSASGSGSAGFQPGPASRRLALPVATASERVQCPGY
jgi:hypothetical protein